MIAVHWSEKTQVWTTIQENNSPPGLLWTRAVTANENEYVNVLDVWLSHSPLNVLPQQASAFIMCAGWLRKMAIHFSGQVVQTTIRFSISFWACFCCDLRSAVVSIILWIVCSIEITEPKKKSMCLADPLANITGVRLYNSWIHYANLKAAHDCLGLLIKDIWVLSKGCKF